MIIKNLSRFAAAYWEDYKTTMAIASKNNKGNSLVESDSELYNFDAICKSLFPNGDAPTSADGIKFDKGNIRLIEFKSGFKQKIRKDTFDPEKGKCQVADEVCKEYWSLFWENQDRKIKELIASIRLKAIESYILLEKHFLPICKDNKPNESSKVVLTVVIDEDGVDGIEDTLADLSASEPKTDNAIIAVKQALKRLSNKKDCYGNTYLYDEIEVLTAKDFENRLKITA